MRATDSHNEDNISATGNAFGLDGGRYGVTCMAASFGTVTLQILAADASTWLNTSAAFVANGYTTADLPAGQYRVAVASATAVYVAIARVPGD